MYKPNYEQDYVIAEDKRKLLSDIINKAALILKDIDPDTRKKFLDYLYEQDLYQKAKSSSAFNHLVYF